MTKRLERVVIAVAVLVVLAGAAPAPAEVRAPALRDKDVLGTWLAEIVLPPNALTGLGGETVMLEYITFTKGGGLVATANFPLFPVPLGGSVGSALVSVSHSSWRRRGDLVQGTNWRFLNDVEDGSFLGFLKNRVEFRLVEHGVLEGEYLVEMLNPDLTLMDLVGVPATVGPGRVRAVKVPVERLPR